MTIPALNELVGLATGCVLLATAVVKLIGHISHLRQQRQRQRLQAPKTRGAAYRVVGTMRSGQP